MILPIEKYKLLNQAYLARRLCCQIDVKLFIDFFGAREGNDRETVNGNN